MLVSRDISYLTFCIWSNLAKTDRTKDCLVALGDIGRLSWIMNIDAYLDTRTLTLDTAVTRLRVATPRWHC